jgi:predicted dehydrogenase
VILISNLENGCSKPGSLRDRIAPIDAGVGQAPRTEKAATGDRMRRDEPGPHLRGALIGCGFVSQHHLRAWPRVPGAHLVAICDRDPAALKRAQAAVPEARAYQEAAALFDREQPLDFVEICTRPGSHCELIEQAARRGVHVLCQKPAAENRADLVAMIEACQAAGTRLMFHENWRFRPWYRALRRSIQDGLIGHPIRLRLSHRDTRALRVDGFADQPYFASMPDLILLEMGCHLVDTARFLLGEIRAVSAAVNRFGEGHEGDDVATLLLDYESGAAGLLDISWCATADHARPEWALNETVVEGTEGMLRLRLDGSLDRIDLTGQSQFVPVSLPPDDEVYVDGYAATQLHFINGLQHGERHETDGQDTLKTMDVVWAAYRSSREGRRVDLVGSEGGPDDLR